MLKGSRTLAIAAAVACLVALVVLRSSPFGREGWKGGDDPPADVIAATKRHCASGQKLPRLQKATPQWNAYSETALKEACRAGQQEFRDAKGKSASCTNVSPCTAAAVKRTYPCQHVSDPSQCCKEDKSDCVSHQQVADAKKQERVKCTGGRPTTCSADQYVKCQKRADGKSFAWMCCKNDRCYDNGDWVSFSGEDKADAADKSGGKGVDICKDSGFGGCKTLTYAGWGNRVHNLSDHGYNDNITSIKVPEGLKATVYDDTDGGGNKWTIFGPKEYTNLKTVSHPSNVDKKSYTCDGSMFNPNNGCWNDRISSIRIQTA